MCLCEENPCNTSPCLHGGVCEGSSGTAVCDCSGIIGWYGTYCDLNINECTAEEVYAHGCHNGGVCVDTPGDYECICDGTGYVGDRCQIGLNNIVMFARIVTKIFKKVLFIIIINFVVFIESSCGDPTPCMNGGRCEGTTGGTSHECACMNVPGTYDCDCSGTGYVGMLCELGLKLKHYVD